MQPLSNAIAQTYDDTLQVVHPLETILTYEAPVIVEKPINQRIKFLLEKLNLSARDFSRAVGVPDNNTQNYLEPRFAQPKAEYLERIVHHFGSINPNWLLTGQGAPFLPNSTPSSDSHNISAKNFQGNITGTNHGSMTQSVGTTTTLPDCEKDLTAAHEKIALLTSQLADKERTIQILLKQTS